MAQDIREMLKGYSPTEPKPSKGHENRFEAKLKEAFPEAKPRRVMLPWIRIAASVVILLGLAYVGYQYFETPTNSNQVVTKENTEEVRSGITLGDLSPDLKKVEDFYVTGINVQLASLENTPENKELVDGYLNRLEDLNQAYQKLNKELNEVGPSEATINALINNLQLRLELLFKLKNKLKELKNLENENISNMQA